MMDDSITEEDPTIDNAFEKDTTSTVANLDDNKLTGVDQLF